MDHSTLLANQPPVGVSARQGNAECRESAKRPNALAHQAAGYILLDSISPNEALAEFKEAIALDPSDSWSYALAAFALTTVGRSAEAIPYINAAMRLGPRPPPLFLYYLGMAYFNMEQYDDAAASLQSATRLNPDDELSFLALAATYGYLGQKQDAKAAIARYNALEVKQGGIPATVNNWVVGFYYLPASHEYRRLRSFPAPARAAANAKMVNAQRDHALTNQASYPPAFVAQC